MTERHVQLVLELELGSVPIAGQLRNADGIASRFAGWLELARLLDDASAGEGPASRAPVTTRERPTSTSNR
jgi:hypothetical protein